MGRWLSIIFQYDAWEYEHKDLGWRGPLAHWLARELASDPAFAATGRYRYVGRRRKREITEV